jgi:hypothetical protein
VVDLSAVRVNATSNSSDARRMMITVEDIAA